jgi:hypothetical protein
MSALDCPPGLRGCHPRVVLAERLTNKHGSAWLIVQYDATYPVPVIRGNAISTTFGRAIVSWFPRASFFNCRSCTVAQYMGADALDKALERAALEEIDGPDRSVALRPPSKHTGPRDAQKAKLYQWQRRQAFYSTSAQCTEEAFRSIIRRACVAIGERVPPVQFSGRMHGAVAYYSGSIASGPSQRREAVALHELAHILQYRWHGGGNATQGHGPEFVAIFIALAGLMMGADADFLEASAKRAGLKVASLPDRIMGARPGDDLERRYAATE